MNWWVDPLHQPVLFWAADELFQLTNQPEPHGLIFFFSKFPSFYGLYGLVEALLNVRAGTETDGEGDRESGRGDATLAAVGH